MTVLARPRVAPAAPPIDPRLGPPLDARLGDLVDARLDALDWPRIYDELDTQGAAILGSLLTGAACDALAASYADAAQHCMPSWVLLLPLADL
ncbi:MAG: hypothetical protein ABIY55_12130 [Kofleriaceae bacterium]